MNGGVPGSGQGRSGSGQQRNPNQVTTTTSPQQTNTAGFFTSTTASPHTTTTTSSSSPTSSPSTASSSPGVQKGAVIGSVLGGIAGLLLLSLLGTWFLQRRKKRQLSEKNSTAQPVTYADLNESMSGVPFVHPPSQNQLHSFLPHPLFNGSTSSSQSGVGIRGGGESDYAPPPQRDSGDYYLPTYAESQSGVSIADQSSLGHLNTSQHTPSEATISPLSTQGPAGHRIISPQTIGALSFLVPQHVRDTMGFPVELDEPGTFHEIQLVSPVPVNPSIHQNSLERVVRQGMLSESPVSSIRNANLLRHDWSGSRQHLEVNRVLSQQMLRESPVLGHNNPVRMFQLPQPSATRLSGGAPPERNQSQRTVSTVSSMGVSIVSDGELERLGVGSSGMNL
jgi:hypothetical protein